jgi:anti-sigma regulatory factor (Ser/Thr protein kinase)
MRFVVPCSFAGVQHLGDSVCSFVKTIPARAAYAVQLITEEIATNIVKYAHDDPDGRDFTVEIEPCEEGVLVRFVDEGKPFDPTKAPEPDLLAPLEDRRPGGLGLPLVQRFAASIRYHREGTRNRLEVRIRLYGA